MIDTIINKCKESEDGIYAFFCDHLSMDANLVLVVKDHEIVTPKKLEFGEGESVVFAKADWRKGILELLMDSNSGYYGSIGFSTGIRILKEMFPGLKTRYCNVGWYTFPQEWKEIKSDGYYAKQCDEMFEVIHFEHGTEKDQ